jgi:YVTN family beta-propeller protein
MKYSRYLLVAACAAVLCSQTGVREQTGPQSDGSVLLPTGWRIQPAGRQIPLDTLPISTALSSDGKFLLVLNAGYKPPSISVLSASSMQEIARVPVADAWLGMTFAPGGKMLYVSGGARGSVYEFTFSADGELKLAREMQATAEHTPRDFIGDVALSPDGRLIYAADLYRDSIVVINPQSGRVIDRFKTGRRPYRILLHPDGRSFFVSSWADAAVLQHNTVNGAELGRVRLGPHTTDMVLSDRKPKVEEGEEAPAWRYRLFVAAANTNTVFAVGIADNKSMKLAETINVALTPRHPLGMTPSALALSPDQTRLLIVCSDANAAAVADISEVRSRVAGFIPTGWYPTAARVLADGRILVLNGKGAGSRPNPAGPGPLEAEKDARRGYVGNMQTGTMSVIDPLTDDALDPYSRTVASLSPYRDADLDAPNIAQDSVIWSRPGRPSPIEHVIYIIKENRTYDQVFGKLGKGNGDPSLTLFDESAAPNHYKLAREFVLFDNFYVNADVSADGHNWSTAAIAPDYTQKLWPSDYGHRLKYYGFEGGEPANTPPAGYLWSNALSAGLSVRNYGEFVSENRVGDPALEKVTNLRFHGFDTAYPDVDRARVFLEDLRQFEASGTMPRLIVMRLPNDHTSGTNPGDVAPLSAFADNDSALGMIVEAVSKSRFWPKTAIFVLEDDAQDGPDHVDSHRSLMFALSPYTRRGIIDSSMYNTASVLRTMELILGLRPLTHYDAGARPLAAAFSATPNNAPYQAEPPRISLTQRNPARSATAARSSRLDFRDADRIDDDELNAILWLAIKNTEPPPPVRSYFSR